mmetsp:Transcript_35291/g.64572  ORF Transcript_35291/g.64572 Transcript_35291/m.64572 type:complete len:310 (-) Transcript_35291:73-1002(-)
MLVTLTGSCLICIFGIVSAVRVEADIDLHVIDSIKGDCSDVVKGSVESKAADEGTLRTYYKWVTHAELRKVKKLCVCDDLTHEVVREDGVPARGLLEPSMPAYGIFPGFTLGEAIFALEDALQASTGPKGQTYECMTHVESLVRRSEAWANSAKAVDFKNGHSEVFNSFWMLRGWSHAIIYAADALDIEILEKKRCKKLNEAWRVLQSAKDGPNKKWKTEIDLAEEALRYVITYLKKVGDRYGTELAEGTKLVGELAADLKEEAGKDSDKGYLDTFFTGEPLEKTRKLLKMSEALTGKLEPELQAIIHE